MSIVDKLLIGLAFAGWVMFYFSRKNLTFGLAIGLSIFSFIYILADF